MTKGSKLLVQSDLCAKYEQFESGEHVWLTAGEFHPEKCLGISRSDSRDVSSRPYRETIVQGAELKPPANKELGRGTVNGV